MEQGNDPRRRRRGRTSPTSSTSTSPARASGSCSRAPAHGALEAVRDHRPRLVVLDVGLPDIDGLEVCRRIRVVGNLPVIFLTARGDEVDRVLGLELGADDYLTKPFSPAELVARVKAVLRRVDGGPPAEIVQAGRVAIDVGRREIRVDEAAGRVHHQGVRPAALPRRAARARARAASRSSTACGATTGTATCAPSTSTSRRSARSSATRCTITTVRGVGYRLESSAPGRRRVSRPRRKLRTRLVVAMSGIAIGVLVITAVATIGLARRSAADDRARSSSSEKAPRSRASSRSSAAACASARPRATSGGAISRLVASTLRISNGGLVTITPDGEVTDGLVGLGDDGVRRAAQRRPARRCPTGSPSTTSTPRALLDRTRCSPAGAAASCSWPGRCTPGATAPRCSCSPRRSRTTRPARPAASSCSPRSVVGRARRSSSRCSSPAG